MWSIPQLLGAIVATIILGVVTNLVSPVVGEQLRIGARGLTESRADRKRRRVQRIKEVSQYPGLEDELEADARGEATVNIVWATSQTIAVLGFTFAVSEGGANESFVSFMLWLSGVEAVFNGVMCVVFRQLAVNARTFARDVRRERLSTRESVPTN